MIRGGYLSKGFLQQKEVVQCVDLMRHQHTRVHSEQCTQSPKVKAKKKSLRSSKLEALAPRLNVEKRNEKNTKYYVKEGTVCVGDEYMMLTIYKKNLSLWVYAG